MFNPAGTNPTTVQLDVSEPDPTSGAEQGGQGNESIRYPCTGPLMLEKQPRII